MGVTVNNTYTSYSLLGTKKELRYCKGCGKELKIGDMVFRKRGHTRRTYHKECWEKLLN